MSICPLAHFLMSRRVILLQEILETFLRKYLVVCGLFCNFAVAMRGMKKLDLRVMAEPVAVAKRARNKMAEECRAIFDFLYIVPGEDRARLMQVCTTSTKPSHRTYGARSQAKCRDVLLLRSFAMELSERW